MVRLRTPTPSAVATTNTPIAAVTESDDEPVTSSNCDHDTNGTVIREGADQECGHEEQRGRRARDHAAHRAEILPTVGGGDFVQEAVPQAEVGEAEQPRRGDQEQPDAESVGRQR